MSIVADYRPVVEQQKPKGISKKSNIKPSELTGAKTGCRCHCGKTYTAKVADIKRGWATSCSKSCAAVKREFGRRNPIHLETGLIIQVTKKKKRKKPVDKRTTRRRIESSEQWDEWVEHDIHPFSEEAFNC